MRFLHFTGPIAAILALGFSAAFAEEFPLVTAFGFNGTWFGVIMIKLAVLIPRVGMNLFAVTGASEGMVTLAESYRGILPFIVIEALVLALLLVFPELSFWLPGQMFAH